jgi:hypothetical protein
MRMGLTQLTADGEHWHAHFAFIYGFRGLILGSAGVVIRQHSWERRRDGGELEFKL